MNVSWSVVSKIMRDLDPVSVDARQRTELRRYLYYDKSPNRVWHLDNIMGLRSTDLLMDTVDAHYE